MPLYEVKLPGADKPRLIEASTPAGARNFALQSVAVSHASQRRVFELASQGVSLEDASGEQPELAPLDKTDPAADKCDAAGD